MENNSYDPKLLAHKLEQGTITPAEKAWFEQWYTSFNDEEIVLSGSKYAAADELRNSIFNKINTKMEVPLKPKRSKSKVVAMWRNIAAAAAMVLLVAFAAFYKDALVNAVAPAKQIQLSSNAGQHRQISLPDGTKVWLSPSTKISYPEKLGSKQRLVELQGEAFFEVEHDAEHPFIIQSGRIKTTVLGTSFNVQAYPGSPGAEVTVVSGKVAVAASAGDKYQQQIMIARQRALFNKANGKLTMENYPEADKFLSQRNGRFAFDGSSLQTVVMQLEQQYGIKISIDKTLSAKEFYGYLVTTDPVTNTLDKLCAVMDAKWNRVDSSYYLQALPAKN